MIRINYDGRLGNQLFQNFAGILLSNKFREKILNPINNGILRNPDFSETHHSSEKIVNSENFLDVYEQVENNSNLILNDFFQNKNIVDLFNKNRNQIMFNPEYSPNNNLFVHVRLGDLLNTSHLDKPWFANFNYYDYVISNLNYDIGYISSDSPNHPIVIELIKKYGLNMFNSSPTETLFFSSQFQHKVLSLGTFSWWVGFLGNQNNIIHPNPKNFPSWHGEIFTFNHWNKI